MNTEYSKNNLKDNIAAATVLTATLVGIFGTLVNSAEARADYVAMQQMETIVVIVPRMEIARMDTIMVIASREANVLVVSNASN